EMPEIADYQQPGRLKPGAIVLLETASQQRSQPLLVWQHYGRGSAYVLATGSTWRWKMQLPHQDKRHHIFWRQLLHALSADAPARASLTSERKVYDDERRVALHAELRNERFEPVNDATVEATVVPDQGTSSTQTVKQR